MKRELGYIYREPQIILQRAAYGLQATDWSPLVYGMKILKHVPVFRHLIVLMQHSYSLSEDFILQCVVVSVMSH